MGQKKKKAPKRSAAGRPSREKLGLEPTIQKTLKVEVSVINILEEKYGSLSNALRTMAGQ